MSRGWVQLLVLTWLRIEEVEGNEIKVDEDEEGIILRI